MEEVLAGHPDVAECAVIGVSDELKGQLPVGFVCLTTGVNRPHDEIARECVAMVRDQIGPVAAFKLAVVVDRLPKTRSGKILRGTMVSIADGKEYKMPATIDDPHDSNRDGRVNATDEILTRLAFQVEGEYKVRAKVDTGFMRNSAYAITPLANRRLRLHEMRGAAWGCGEVEPGEDETGERYPQRIVDAFHAEIFSPRVDLSRIDINSLDGSNRVTRNPLRDLMSP